MNNVSNQTFVFIGRSGSGKGTQAQLIIKYLEKTTGQKTLYVQTGAEVRKFVTGDSFTQRLSKIENDKGGFQPEFVIAYTFAKQFIEEFTGEQNIVIDGSPRKIHEAGILHSVFSFYGIPKPYIVYIHIEKEESERRLLARGRPDDTVEDIAFKNEWYESRVAPTVEYYRNNPHYNFIEVNGAQSVEKIHEDIVVASKKFI